MPYSAKLLQHCDQPRHVGSFDARDPAVGTGLAGSPAAGTVIRLQIKVDAGSGRIADACFKAHGCGAAIAAGSLAAQWLRGRRLDDALRIEPQLIVAELELPPLKMHCAILAADAIKAAVQDHRARHPAPSPDPHPVDLQA